MILEFASLLVIPVGGWGMTKIVQHGERLAALEALAGKVDKQLDRIEDKIDGQTGRSTPRFSR